MVQASKKKPSVKHVVQAGLGLAIGMGFGAAAHAEANPYYLGGSLGYSRVSNIFRTADSGNSDDVTTASLMAGLDQQIGRQHLTVDGTLQENRYRYNTPLNNQSYSLRGNLDWQTIERISGSLSASANQQLANYNLTGAGVQQSTDKNIERDQQVQGLVRVGLVTRWSMEASLTHFSQDYSLAAYNALVFNQNAGSLGLVYKANDLLRLGVALRRTNGEYPRYPVSVQPAPGVIPVLVYEFDTFKRNDVDLTGNWSPTGASNLDARLSWSQATHDTATLLNYKGVTGSLGWNWQPSGKLSLGTRLTRDTGSQLATVNTTQSRVGYALDGNARYQLTGKITLTATLGLHRSNYVSDIVNGGSTRFNDRNLSLGATYAFSRSVSFICQANRSQRSSSNAFYDYSASGYGCTVQGLLY